MVFMNWRDTYLIPTIVGVASGLVSSGIFWLVVSRLLTPFIYVRRDLAEFNNEKGKLITQVCIYNLGRGAIYDLEVRASIRMRGIAHESTTDTLRLTPIDSDIVRASTKVHRYALSPDRAAAFHNYVRFLPADLRSWYAAGGRVSVRDLLNAFPGSSVEILISGAHGYTGSRTHEVRTFYVHNFSEGRATAEMSKKRRVRLRVARLLRLKPRRAS